MTGQTVYQRNPDSAGRVVNGQAFIVTPDSSEMHTLNSTATLLWTLAKQGFTVAEAADELVLHYEVSREQAVADLEGCLPGLVKREILRAL